MKMSMTPRRPAKPGAAFTRIELAAVLAALPALARSREPGRTENSVNAP